MKKVTQYEIINHGYCLPDYFQGCGTYSTKFDHCVTGSGNSAKEAYEDAVEQIASEIGDDPRLPTRPRGIRARDKVPADYEDSYWYVSIRYK